MGFFNNFFGRKTIEVEQVTKQARRNPPVDMTGGDVADAKRLKALYKGSDLLTQFSAPYAYTPINVPSAFVGVPIPVSEDPATMEAVNDVMKKNLDECPIITRTMLLMGTAWRWAKYSEQKKDIVWESIPDETITALGINMATGNIEEVYTTETIEIMQGEEKVKVKRERKITASEIEIKYADKGGYKGELESVRMKNVFGTMPRPFGHDCLEGEWRGISIFSRIYRLMRSTHEIKLNREQTLSKFRAKQVQTMAKAEVNSWLANNGYSSLTDVDPLQSDFILNVEEQTTQLIYLPSDATTQHTNAIKDNRNEFYIGSGLPELFWSLLATGNAASTDTQRDQAIQYVNEIRREMTRQYELLINDTLKIKGYIDMRNYQPVTISWDRFDMLSMETRARIFDIVMAGAGKLIASAIGTRKDLYYFIKAFYPDIPEQTQEDFEKDINPMLKFTAKLKSNFMDSLDLGAYEDDPNTGEDDAREDGDNAEETDTAK